MNKSAYSFSIVTTLLVFVLIVSSSGCTSKYPMEVTKTGVSSGSTSIQSKTESSQQQSQKEQQVSKITPVDTFEYTEDELRQLNEYKHIEDFYIDKSNGEVYISGIINTSKVKNEQDVLEQLMLVRSIIGLRNPKEQLKLEYKSDNSYRFKQYHNGLPVYGSVVNVNLDLGIITLVGAMTYTVELLNGVDYETLSESEIAQAYSDLDIKNKQIWCYQEYADKPIVVYILDSGFETFIVDAKTGKTVNSWSNIMTEN